MIGRLIDVRNKKIIFFIPLIITINFGLDLFLVLFDLFLFGLFVLIGS